MIDFRFSWYGACWSIVFSFRMTMKKKKLGTWFNLRHQYQHRLQLWRGSLSRDHIWSSRVSELSQKTRTTFTFSKYMLKINVRICSFKLKISANKETHAWIHEWFECWRRWMISNEFLTNKLLNVVVDDQHQCMLNTKKCSKPPTTTHRKHHTLNQYYLYVSILGREGEGVPLTLWRLKWCYEEWILT